ncbi:hypothetical protein KSP39_PZI000881 [Platanthera zijinensis]|uniref:Uncharacterized protein n=1 Tax=Platanthera zijinensis TaxID=2320716 RepID=A0AAP0GFE3_9ASPA
MRFFPIGHASSRSARLLADTHTAGKSGQRESTVDLAPVKHIPFSLTLGHYRSRELRGPRRERRHEYQYLSSSIYRVRGDGVWATFPRQEEAVRFSRTHTNNEKMISGVLDLIDPDRECGDFFLRRNCSRNLKSQPLLRAAVHSDPLPSPVKCF